MLLEVPLGIDDFLQVHEPGPTYVDETHLVRERLDLSTLRCSLRTEWLAIAGPVRST